MRTTLLLVCLVCAGASTSGSYNDNGGSYEDDIDTTAPTLTPTEAPTPTPTKAPDEETGSYENTDEESGSDTPKDTPRKKPAFDAAAFAKDLEGFVIVESTAGVTLPPTKAPTPAPVPKGMYAKTKVVQKKALKAKMKFPFEGEEVENSLAVQGALTDGMAAAVGVEKENVQIGAVDGKKLGEGRRLADAEITFIIIADNAADLEALSKDVVAAAKEGSIVANVQKAAAANGVLTAGLKAMTLSQIITAPETTTVPVTVVIYLKGDDPTKKPDDNLNAASLPALSSMASAICLAMITVLVA